MEFTCFASIIREEVEKRTGGAHRVRIDDVMKNNGVVLSGLTVTQEDSNISPTIYLNGYYEEYEDGRITLKDVVSDVLDTYNRNRVNRSVDMRDFLDYEYIKGCIVYKLVNAEKNKELLEDVPYVPFLDLAVVFQCLIVKEHLGTAAILIHNAHLKLWDVSLDELYETARDNTQRIQKYEIRSMKEALGEIMLEGIQEPDHDACLAFTDSVPVYVLSNESRVDGAACILYPELIKHFAEAVGSSFYIIPSSVHEVLLLPADNVDESGEIKEMIKEINDLHVKKEEVLSYSLYFYDRKAERTVRL